jgi:hypothetical protein
MASRPWEDLRTYDTALRELPKLYNGMLLPVPAVEHMGFTVMITGGTIGVICKALQDAFRELKEHDMVSSSRLATRDDITGVLGLASDHRPRGGASLAGIGSSSAPGDVR